MAEEHRRERPFTIRDNEISGNRTAVRTRIGNVVKGAVGELFNDLVVDVERLFGIVVEEMDQGLEIAGRPGFGSSGSQSRSEKNGQNITHGTAHSGNHCAPPDKPNTGPLFCIVLEFATIPAPGIWRYFAFLLTA